MMPKEGLFFALYQFDEVFFTFQLFDARELSCQCDLGLFETCFLFNDDVIILNLESFIINSVNGVVIKGNAQDQNLQQRKWQDKKCAQKKENASNEQ